MAKDIQETIRDILSEAVGDATKAVTPSRDGKKGGPLSGMKGIAAGAGAVALAPLAAKGVGKLAKTFVSDGLNGVVKAPGEALGGATSKLGSTVGSGIGDKITGKIDESGGPGGIVKDAVKGALPFGGDDDDDDDDQSGGKGGVPGVGKGRRMPVQQSIDIAVPIETAYNQWTQFELWPNFMHRVTRVTHDDDCTVSFATKIWGKTKEFTAQIETQRPDERIKWRVTNGITHTGVVTFHEIAPRLTRVELNLDLDPGGMLEKAARGMRHVKRAARGDLHRFKAFIEMQENETGAWRGVIEDGELVEEHDPSYDKERDYSEFEDIYPGENGDRADDDEDDEEEEDSGSRSSGRSAASSRSGSSSSRSRSSGSRSGSSGRSKSSSSGGRSGSSSSRKSSGSSRSGSSSSRKSSGSSRSGSSSSRKSSGSSRSGSSRERGRHATAAANARAAGPPRTEARPRAAGRAHPHHVARATTATASVRVRAAAGVRRSRWRSTAGRSSLRPYRPHSRTIPPRNRRSGGSCCRPSAPSCSARVWRRQAGSRSDRGAGMQWRTSRTG